MRIRQRRRPPSHSSLFTRIVLQLLMILLALAPLLILRVLFGPPGQMESSPNAAASSLNTFKGDKAKSGNIVELKLSGEKTVRIRIELLETEAPQAARYIRDLVLGHDCGDCNIYRAEPVPEYWGSAEYPDRVIDGGRWGPPYALVQGQLLDSERAVDPPPPDHHRPLIERGMVAWAGGDGGPHFFIALANHPEWQHGHAVWARVLPEDMPRVDAIVELPLRKVVNKRPPDLMYLREKIDFSVSLVA